MNRIFSYVFAALIGATIATLIFYFATRDHDSLPDLTVTEAVTVDTVRAVAPMPMELLSVRFEPVKLPSLALTKPQFQRPDSLMLDSVTVTVPIETKIYTDSSTYRAVISGFRASLDTIDIYNRTVERTVSVTPTKRPRRWGLSVGVGAVATPSGRIEPGVFAGVSYQFVSF